MIDELEQLLPKDDKQMSTTTERQGKQMCSIPGCDKRSIPGLIRGHGKCQYHWNAGVWGKEWADKAAASDDTPQHRFAVFVEGIQNPYFVDAANRNDAKTRIESQGMRVMWIVSVNQSAQLPMPTTEESVAWAEEASVIADVLREMSGRFNKIDNGHCTICGGFRLYNTRSQMQPCENSECLSHRIGEILERYELPSKATLARIKDSVRAALANSPTANSITETLNLNDMRQVYAEEQPCND